MSNLTSRHDDILARFRRHWLEEITVAVSPIDRDDWNEAEAEEPGSWGPYGRFGIGVPMPLDEDDADVGLTVPFCVPIIEDVVTDLDDEALNQYLDALETLIDLTITRMLNEKDEPEDAIRWAEQWLNDSEWRRSLKLFSRVQLAYLDRLAS